MGCGALLGASGSARCSSVTRLCPLTTASAPQEPSLRGALGLCTGAPPPACTPPLPSGLLGAPQEGPVWELTWGSPARVVDGGLGRGGDHRVGCVFQLPPGVEPQSSATLCSSHSYSGELKELPGGKPQINKRKARKLACSFLPQRWPMAFPVSSAAPVCICI